METDQILELLLINLLYYAEQIELRCITSSFSVGISKILC